MAEVALQSQTPTRGPVGNYYDGVFATSVIYLKTKIIGISNAYMRFKTDVEWLIMPSDRYNDIIGIGIESNKVLIASAIKFRQDWVTTNNTFGNDTVCAPKDESTGGSAVFTLPSGSLSELESYIYFNVTKQPNVGTITHLYNSGNYAHADGNVNINTIFNNYNVYHNAGIIVDSAYAYYYDTTTPVHALFEGTW